MSPLKKGTKLTDNPRNKRLEMRLTEEQNIMLNECAEKMSMTRTDVVVEGIKLVKKSLDEK